MGSDQSFTKKTAEGKLQFHRLPTIYLRGLNISSISYKYQLKWFISINKDIECKNIDFLSWGFSSRVPSATI